MSDLFTPPRFFENVKFHRHTQRSVGWLELFYDLVYVATLIQIGNFLSDNLSLIGFGQFLVLLTVVWWAWTGETFYQNRFVVDDLLHRLLVFVQIFAIGVLGLSISEAFGDLYQQFTIAYILTRLVLILMYVRVGRSHPESRPFSQGFVIGFSIGLVIWIGSLFLPAEYHWVGWLLGIGFELLVPLFPNVRQYRQQWNVDNHHISERFGIFTIIVLGESFVKAISNSQGAALTFDSILFSLFAMPIIYSLWWLYFADTGDKWIDFEDELKGLGWVYSHLFLSAGLIAYGVAGKKVFAAALAYPSDVLKPEYRILFTVSIVLYLVALAVIDFAIVNEESHHTQNREAVIHFVSAIVVAVLGFFFTQVTPTQYVFMIAVVMFSQVGWSIYQSRQVV